MPLVTITFDTDTLDLVPNTTEHAKVIVERYLAGKGVYPRGEVELTNGRVEKRWGYELVDNDKICTNTKTTS